MVDSAREAVVMMLQATEQKRLIMIIGLWFIWSERNLIREEGRGRSPQLLARSVELYAKENSLMGCEKAVKLARCRPQWTKPPTETLKLNCDASFLLESRAGSWGFIIRDADGDTVVSGRGKVNHLLDAFHAELIACIQGIQVAANIGVGKIILESDAQEVVKALRSNLYDGSSAGDLIDEVRSLLSSNFLHLSAFMLVDFVIGPLTSWLF